MNGWLIYDRKGAVRNAWFIQKCIDEAARAGLSLTLRYTDELIVGADTRGAFALHDGHAPGFAIVRAMRPDISQALEAAGVRVFNTAAVSRAANDKRESALLFSRLNLPMMRTYFITEPGAPCLIPFPAVVKPARGHGGAHVTLVQNEQAYACALVDILPYDAAVVQPLCDQPGRDKRVYALGGRVLCAMARESKGGFRANFSLGGNANPEPLTPDEERLARAVLDALEPDLIGIDLIYHEGKPVLNEIEDVVGTRMLYASTSLDAARLYMEYIARVLK